MSVNAAHSGRKKKAAAPLRQSGVVLSSFPGQRLALTAGGAGCALVVSRRSSKFPFGAVSSEQHV